MSNEKLPYVSPDVAEASSDFIRWSIWDLELMAQEDHDWWTFPVKAVFTHQGSGQEIEV